MYKSRLQHVGLWGLGGMNDGQSYLLTLAEF